MPTIVYYNAYGDGDEESHRHQLTMIADYDLDDDTWNDSIAEQCADDWHDNHDGWEASWPRVFAIFSDKKGPAFARFEINREYEPTFSATAIDA